MINDLQNNVTTGNVIDLTSLFVIVGALTNFLPPVAALFTIIWLAIRIWESDTVRGLTGRTIGVDKDRNDD